MLGGEAVHQVGHQELARCGAGADAEGAGHHLAPLAQAVPQAAVPLQGVLRVGAHLSPGAAQGDPVASTFQ